MPPPQSTIAYINIPNAPLPLVPVPGRRASLRQPSKPHQGSDRVFRNRTYLELGLLLHMKRDLGGFTGRGYDKGRPLAVQVAWVLIASPLFRSVWCPSRLRVALLRLFGASIGEGVVIRQDVRIHWPWKLIVGDNVWIGVESWLLNLEPITIGSNVCISQGAFLCTGSHDASSPTFEFDNAPISVEDGAWIAARAAVLRGVTIGSSAVVGATALVTKNVPPGARVLAPLALEVGASGGR